MKRLWAGLLAMFLALALPVAAVAEALAPEEAICAGEVVNEAEEAPVEEIEEFTLGEEESPAAEDEPAPAAEDAVVAPATEGEAAPTPEESEDEHAVLAAPNEAAAPDGVEVSDGERAVAAASGVAINATNFPDKVFRNYVSKEFDTNRDGVLSSAECAAVEEIYVKGMKISSLVGIQYFPNLNYLDCRGNSINRLDISRNPNLGMLSCEGNPIDRLDISRNPDLAELCKAVFGEGEDVGFRDDRKDYIDYDDDLNNCMSFSSKTVLILNGVAVDGASCAHTNVYLKKAGAKNGTVTLGVGEARQIVPTFAINKLWMVQSYASSKPDVVALGGDGLAIAKAEGKATLTVKTVNGKKATLTVKVVDKNKPKKIAITQGKSVKLELGKTLKLGTTLTPSNAKATLKWKSSKEKVATVDAGGTVTALKEGTAKITVKTQNGKKAVIKVKVFDPNKPTKISITQGKKVTLRVGQTLKLGTTLTPGTAQATLTWKSSKAKVASVDADGTVKALRAGTAKITVKTHNGKKAAIKVKVKNANEVDFPIKLSFGGTACWSEFTLYKDWTFKGTYGWREDGWNSPSGGGKISGKMANVKKIGDYTYKMTIGSYTAKDYETKADDRGNVYGIRDKGDVLYLYLPGIDSNNILGWEGAHESATKKYYMYNQSTKALYFVY